MIKPAEVCCRANDESTASVLARQTRASAAEGCGPRKTWDETWLVRLTSAHTDTHTHTGTDGYDGIPNWRTIPVCMRATTTIDGLAAAAAAAAAISEQPTHVHGASPVACRAAGQAPLRTSTCNVVQTVAARRRRLCMPPSAGRLPSSLTGRARSQSSNVEDCRMLSLDMSADSPPVRSTEAGFIIRRHFTGPSPQGPDTYKWAFNGTLHLAQ